MKPWIYHAKTKAWTVFADWLGASKARAAFTLEPAGACDMGGETQRPLAPPIMAMHPCAAVYAALRKLAMLR